VLPMCPVRSVTYVSGRSGSKPGPPTSRTRNKSAKAILAETRIYMLFGCGLDLDGVLQTFRIVHLRVVRLQTFRM
jgi:hypothetical protein